MPNFTAGTSFTDGVTNDVTALKLNALVADAVPTSSLALTSTNGTIANFTASTANITLGTIPTLTAGTTTGTAGIFTSGTITTGVIPTLTAGTTTSTNAVVTNGTITNLSATTSTFLGTITGSTNVVNIGSGQIYKDASGNVGIGTTSPDSVLSVYAPDKTTPAISARYNAAGFKAGLSVYNSLGFPYLSFNSNPVAGATNNATYDINGVASKIDFATGSGSADIIFSNAASGTAGSTISWLERMRIDSSGNVGIGTASPAANSQMTVVSQSTTKTAALLSISATSSTAFPPLTIQKQDNNSTTSQVFVSFNINAGVNGSGQINANGANAAAFGAQSDIRLKENITALPNQIDNVCALKPCEFDYKDGSGHQIGFIAQEIQEVYPDCVGDRGDGMLTVTGWSKTEARLVKAIQELKAKNNSLEARLEALESK